MNKRFTIFLTLVVAFLLFCVYTYKVRTKFNVDKRDEQLKVSHYENQVLTYALSLYPEELRTQLFFKALKEKHPLFVEDKDLCKALGYNEAPKEKNKEEKEELDSKDTTAVKVMDEIISTF